MEEPMTAEKDLRLLQLIMRINSEGGDVWFISHTDSPEVLWVMVHRFEEGKKYSQGKIIDLNFVPRGFNDLDALACEAVNELWDNVRREAGILE